MRVLGILAVLMLVNVFVPTANAADRHEFVTDLVNDAWMTIPEEVRDLSGEIVCVSFTYTRIEEMNGQLEPEYQEGGRSFAAPGYGYDAALDAYYEGLYRFTIETNGSSSDCVAAYTISAIGALDRHNVQ